MTRSLVLLMGCSALMAPVLCCSQTAGAGAAQQRPDSGTLAVDAARFDVLEYRVLGNTVLPAAQIESLLYPLLGVDKTLEDVQAARAKLESFYHDKGYPSVFVDVPEQDVDEGIVRLAVIEARLARVRASGARYYSHRKILAEVPAARTGEVMFLPALREQLDAVNRGGADRVVTPVLRAGARPGTVDLELRVKDELPLHASLEVNDRYTPNTSRWRVNGTLSYDNVGQRGDTASLSYQTSPENPDDTSILTVNYTLKLAASHLLAFYVLDSNSDIQAAGTLGVLGKGRVYGFRDVHILPAASGASHNVSCGGDYKDYDDTVRVIAVNDADSSEEVAQIESGIEYVNFNCAYSRAVAEGLLGGELRWSLGANLGLRGLGNTPEEFAVKRFKARPNYLALDASLSQSFALPGGLAFMFAGDAQYSREPLINNEQYAVGGMDSVRGYAESQQLADSGYRVTGELQSGELGASLWRNAGFQQLQLFGFTDYARLMLQEPLPEQQSKFKLFSAGAGLRLRWHEVAAQIYWANALHDSGSIEAGDSRWHFLMHVGM